MAEWTERQTVWWLWELKLDNWLELKLERLMDIQWEEKKKQMMEW